MVTLIDFFLIERYSRYNLEKAILQRCNPMKINMSYCNNEKKKGYVLCSVLKNVCLLQVSGLTKQYQVQCGGDSETSETLIMF